MWADLFEHCRRTHGPVQVRVAACVAGLNVATVRDRARREGWWMPYHDVVAPPGTPRTSTYWGLAAVARAAGPMHDAPLPAALARWSAASAYGVHRGWPTAVEVAVAGDRSPARDSRFAPIRARSFDPAAIRHVGPLALPVVDAPWLVRDLARVASTEKIVALVIDLVQRRHLTLEKLAADLDAHPRFPGRRRVLVALERLEGAGRVDSAPELEVRERLLAEGIPLDVGQIEVVCRDGVSIHLDLGIAGVRFGIEFDSMLAHATRSQLRNDVRRSNELARLPDGWRVLRMTAEDLGGGWDGFVGLVREVVADQSRRHLGTDWPR